MSKQLDYDALARSFLDLWQDQATRMGQDPEMWALVQHWMALFVSPTHTPAPVEPESAAERDEGGFTPDYRPGGACRVADGGPGAIGERRGVDEGPEAREPGAPAENGSAAVAAIPDDRDAELERLAARVRELEKRLASLEARRRDSASGSGTPTERRRAGDARQRRF